MRTQIKIEGFKAYSSWKYIIRLSAVVLIMFVCFVILSNDSTPTSGFITSSFAFFAITIAATAILLQEKKWIIFFLVAYLVHLGVGFIHYLYFIDPYYFVSNGKNLPLTYDYTYTLKTINEIVLAKHKNGIFHFKAVNISHSELINIISYPFAYFGVYILNIAPINSFMSVFTSINILLISKHYLRFKKNRLNNIAILTAYFPLTLISSLLYRDVIGLGIMSVGLTLIVLSPKGIIKYLFLALACYLFYLQRTIYPMVLLVAFFSEYLIVSKGSSSFIRKLIYFAIFIILLIFSIEVGLLEGQNSRYIVRASQNVNYFFIPVKIIMGIIGPFPWTQYFTTGRIEYSYQFSDYLQGTFNITMILLMIAYFHSFFKTNAFNILNLTGLVLMLSGLLTTFMHITYVSIGVIFLIPWIVNSSPWINFKRFYFISFMCLLLISFIITVFFGSLGIKSLWSN